MKQIQPVTIQVRCQKNKEISFVPKRGESQGGRTEWIFAREDAQGAVVLADIPGGFAGRLSLELHGQPLDEHQNLAMENPVAAAFCVKERPEKITAMYLFNDWWTRPAFLDDFRRIPERTQIAFLKYPDRYACLVPAVGEFSNKKYYR